MCSLFGGLLASLAAFALAVVAKVKHEQWALLWLPLSVFPALLAFLLLGEAFWWEEQTVAAHSGSGDGSPGRRGVDYLRSRVRKLNCDRVVRRCLTRIGAAGSCDDSLSLLP